MATRAATKGMNRSAQLEDCSCRPWRGSMEELGYLAVSGEHITLQRRLHSASCREFSVRSPRLQLRLLSAATCSVWLVAYGLFVLSENSMVLSAAIFITIISLITYLHFVKIDQESLLVIGSLGIQMTSFYASGKESTTFIEMGQVKDVVINEAIYMVNAALSHFCFTVLM
uniref:Phosphatidylinositol glycan anchor biosynthesis class H n=1 Tax=Sphenodon punctatus TaxID=8508 RepID=A0A8D0HC99_SPHPU